MFLLLMGCPDPAPADESASPDPQETAVEETGSDEPWGRREASLTLQTSPTEDRPATAGNAFVGFVPAWIWGGPENDLAYSMEYVPISMAELNPSEGTYDFGPLETWLADAESRGNHVIVRIWVDWPAKESGLPGWLESKVATTAYTEHGGGMAPDWSDPDLQDAMVDLVEALGEAYSDDIRIGTVQAGLVGFWGEWHTWPHDWMPDEDYQARLLSAYREAFPNTPLQVRLPYANANDLGFGYHDDSFAYSTVGETGWFFVPTLESAGADDAWRTAPIGGELRPELQSTIFTDAYVEGEYAQNYLECVEATHASWLLNHLAFRATDEELEATREASLALGSAYAITTAELLIEGYAEGQVDAKVRVQWQNLGVAPDYHDQELVVQWGERTTRWPATTTSESSRLGEYEFGRVPVEELEGTLEFHLDSAWLLEGQQLNLANPGGTLTLEVEAGCDESPVGTVVDGCICDVDGVFRDRDGNSC